MKYNIKNTLFSSFRFIALLLICILSADAVYGVTTTATLSVNGGWSDPGDTKWAGGGGVNGAPDADDNIVINQGITLTMDGNFTTTGTLTVGGGAGNDATIDLAGYTLTCGAVSLGAPTTASKASIVAVGAGILTCTSIAMASTGNSSKDCILSISTGTVTVSGNITLSGATNENAITFTSTGLLQLAGTWTTGKGFTRSFGTVEFNSSGAQTVTTGYTYYNLKCSGAGTIKSISAAASVAGNLTVDGCTVRYSNSPITQTITGNLIINNNGILDHNQDNLTTTCAALVMSGTSTISRSSQATQTINCTTFSVSAGAAANIYDDITLNVSSTSQIDGAYTVNTQSATSAVKTFTGLVTLGSSGTWTTTFVTGSNKLVFQGGITHGNSTANTFTAGRATFNTNSQTLTGPGTLNFSDIVTVTGAAVNITNNTTVNMTKNAAAVLTTGTAGATWTQGANSTLNYTGTTMTNITLDASASGNTVSYNNSAAGQTIFDPVSHTYFNLTLDNTTGTARTKTLSATADINGNLTISATASTGNTIFSASTFDITLAGNWINNSTNATPFTCGTRTVTFDGTADQNITGSTSTTFYNLTLNNTGTSGNDDVILGIPTTVSNVLTLTDGILNTDATNLLYLTNTATTASTGGNSAGPSFVSGPMTWSVTSTGSTYIFPTGKGSTKWARIGVVAPNAAGAFTCEFFNSAPSNQTQKVAAPSTYSLTYVSNKEYWDAARTSGTATAQIQLFWEDNTFSAITTCNNLMVAHYTSSKWQNEGSTGCSYGTAGSITGANVLSTFSPFTFGSDAPFDGTINPLPIELLSFDAQPKGDRVDLIWTTASEINNDFFTIEKTIDGLNFEPIAVIKGAGNSTNMINYSAHDNSPFDGIAYYRLKQTDFDGNYTYSDLKAVRFEDENDFSFNIYPNPNDGNAFNLQIRTNNDQEVLVVVYDVLGNEMYSKVIISGENDNNIHAIDPSQQLPAGVYLVTATSNDSILNKRLVVK